MSKQIFVLKVFDNVSDCSWEWAFTMVPSMQDVQVAVDRFLLTWKNDDKVMPYYTSWVGVDFTKLSPFIGHLTKSSRQLKRCSMMLSKIDIVK